MTNVQTAKLMGDPPFRADAHADVIERFDRNRADFSKRLAPSSIEEQVIALWNDEQPIGAIADRTGLTLGQIYRIVSAA